LPEEEPELRYVPEEEPELRYVPEDEPERDEDETPERLTLEARVADDAALDADVALVPDALLRFTEEERTEAPLRPVEEEERVRTLERADALRETEEPERTATLPSRCPSWAPREGSQRWPMAPQLL
jgi:hypothetical protein